jgi:hypothetical protein
VELDPNGGGEFGDGDGRGVRHRTDAGDITLERFRARTGDSATGRAS